MAKIAKDPKTGARRPVRHSPISRENAEHYRWGVDCDGWFLVRDKALSVIEEFMPPGSAEVRHHHEHAQQFFYILDGEVLMEVDGENHLLAAGAPSAHALTSGFQRALLVGSIFILASAVIALRATNTRGETAEPAIEAEPEASLAA